MKGNGTLIIAIYLYVYIAFNFSLLLAFKVGSGTICDRICENLTRLCKFMFLVSNKVSASMQITFGATTLHSNNRKKDGSTAMKQVSELLLRLR